MPILAAFRASVMRDKALKDARGEQQELEALHRLDEECVHQQRAGNYLKAFDCMERALVLRRHFFGIESEEVIQACRALAEMCNLLAMSFLQQDNYTVTIDLLKKAEVLTQRHHPVERATTLNNLACYYRRLGKLHSAMTSLKRALELEKRLENVRNAADTQLNMCAVLSQLGKHQEALEHAQEALITLQEGFIHGKHTTDTTSTTGDTSSSKLDRMSVMCIAYHNVGVEQEFLKDYAESVASYKKGIGLAEQYLGSDHSITTTIRNSYLAAKRTLAMKARVKPSSASRDQESPSKAGSRLLLSPRSGALRMPSPLAKEKDRHSGSQIPTPRSIVADALSRAPLSALPPLEIQRPPSAGKKKKKSQPNAASLSPTDPFFSPRFNFDSNSTVGKPKKLASITNPRSAAAARVQVKTPQSSKDKHERRKSSVKRPPGTAEPDARTTKSSHKERRKTAPRPSEENLATSVVASQNVNGATSAEDSASRESMTTELSVESAALTTRDLTAKAMDNKNMESIVELSQKKSELKLSSRSDLEENLTGHAQMIDVGSTKQTEPNVPVVDTASNEAVQNLDEEDVASTISTLLTSIVELVAGQETTSDIICEKDCTNVKYPPKEEISFDAAYDDHTATFLSSGRNVEVSDENHDEPDAAIVVEVEQEEHTNGFNGIYIPDEYNTTEDTTDAFTSRDYDTNVTGPAGDTTTEDVYIQESAFADEATEPSLLSSENTAATESLNTDNTVDEDKIKDIPADLESDVNITENTSHFEEELNEIAREEAPEMEVEDCAETVFGSLASAEEMTDAAIDTYNYVLENEAYLLEAPENYESTAYEAEQTIPNADERDDKYQEHFSNDAEDFASALFKYEAQEDLPAESSGEVYHDDYPAPEHIIPVPDVAASEYAYEEIHHGEVDTENGPLEPEFLDETEQDLYNYELQDQEHVIDASASTPEQEWNHAEQAEYAAVETATEYGDDALELPVHSHEEFSYEQAAVPEYYNDQLPELENSDTHT